MAEVGAEGTMPRYLQSMVSLCWAPVLPGASWDPSGGGSCSGGSSVPGDALNPLPAAPGTAMAVVWGGTERWGLQQEVAAGHSSLMLWLLGQPDVLTGELVGGRQCWDWVPALLGKRVEPWGAGGTPRQSPAEAGGQTAGVFAEPEAPPTVPIALASCLCSRLWSGGPDVSSPFLPPRFLGGN